MTKISRKLMIVISVVLIILLILSRVAIQNDLNEKDDFLKDFATRKEGLQNTHDKLQEFVENLNSTLQAEIARQDDLKKQLEILSKSPVTVNPNKTVSIPPVPSTPAPSTTPVTRAS